MKPVYVQKRREPTLTRMDKDTDGNVFMRNEYYYGTDARGAAFLTLPHLAFGGFVAA
jgi:phage major head subunit gpT-like protein